MEMDEESQKPVYTSATEHLSRAFIDALSVQSYSPDTIRFAELGPSNLDPDLQITDITATQAGWLLYTRFKENWPIK